MDGRSAAHQLNSLPFILTDNDKVVEVGDKFVELTGYDKASVLGMDINHLCCNLLKLTHNFEELYKGKENFFMFTKELEPREVKIEVKATEEESRELITFCEKPDSRFETKDMYLHQLCRSELMGVAVYTAELVLVMANQKYLDFLEYPYNHREYSIGHRIEDIIGGWKGSPVEAFWRKAIDTGKPVQVNEYMHRGYKKGVTYWDLLITPVLERGKVKFVVSNTSDVTERVENRKKVEEQVICEQIIKEQQEQLLKAERAEKQALEKAMKMKDEFLATITHEFKTPLTVINAAVQTIETIYGSEISENVKKHIRRIKINSFRQLRLVNNLLDITRYKAGHFKMHKKNMDIVYLSRYITKSVDLYAKQKGVELSFSSDIAFKEIAIDEEKYERILLNLLSNAIKFTPQGRAICVEVSYKRKEAIISVRDEGIGIPKNKIGMIFERFGQVDSSLSQQAEGTGIGLTLVKTLVEGLGGTIDVVSEVGRGSTFTVKLPAVKLKRGSAEKKPVPREDSRIMQAVVIEFSDIYLD